MSWVGKIEKLTIGGDDYSGLESISGSLEELRLNKLKEARDQCTFANIWTQDGKIMFKDDNKG